MLRTCFDFESDHLCTLFELLWACLVSKYLGNPDPKIRAQNMQDIYQGEFIPGTYEASPWHSEFRQDYLNACYWL